MPVFGTMAARFNDDGVTALYQALLPKLVEIGLKASAGVLPPVTTRHSTAQTPIVPPARVRYLAEIAETVRGYNTRGRGRRDIARERQELDRDVADAFRERPPAWPFRASGAREFRS